MSAPGAVLFDLDGTLLDTLGDFLTAFEKLARENRRPVPRAGQMRHLLSYGARMMVAEALGLEEEDPALEKHRLRFLDIYREVSGQKARLFPGMGEVLTHLRGREIPWGVVTNKFRIHSTELLDRLALQVPALVCADDLERAKPAPDGIHKACSTLCADPARSLYIGDHHRDMAAAKAAGARAVAAMWGYAAPGEMETSQPDHSVEKPGDLVPLIERFLRP